jgi:hypothetical protein
MDHEHECQRCSQDMCFRGPIRSAEYNPVAHGGVHWIEYCSCGAQREVNSNCGQLEIGEWYFPDEP